MAKSDIWMKLYIGDYLADTQALTAEQHGSYLLLLMSYYRTGPLPNDAKKLSQVARATIKKWNTISGVILSFFHLGADGMWHHKRADSEMESNRIAAEKNKDKAEKAAAARWGNDATSNAPSMNQSPKQASEIPPLVNAPSMVSQKLEVRSHKEQPQKQRPSRSRKGERVPDPRHGEFREAFRTYFLYKNTGVEQEPWDAQEAAQLSRFLAKNPNFTTEQWKRLLKNRAGSRVAHGENLSSWVGRALTWATAPNQSNGGFTDAKPTIADNLAAKQGTVDARAARRVALEPDNPGRILEAGSASAGADGDRRALGPLLEAAR